MPSFGFELKTLARLSLPAVLSQLGMTAMGAIDTLLLGRVGVQELAAAALGNVWEWTWLCLGFGLVTGIEPMISQAHGRGDGAAAGLALQRGIVVALLASVPIATALLWTEAGLCWLGQDPALAALAGRYNAHKLPVIPCYMIFAALRQYLQGRTMMTPPSVVMWVGNGVHLPLSAALIFGWGGLPALGIEGAALAESITFVLLVVGLSLWVRGWRLHAGAWQPWSRASLSGLGRVVRLGTPVSLQIALEARAFSIAALMAGWLDPDAVGSHQIALSLAVFSFMVPLGLAQGAATRVGNLVGAGDSRQMRRAILRGMGRPDAGAALSLVGYYVIALPLGYVLCFVAGLGLPGLWTALAVGLVVLAVTLLLHVRRSARRPLSELQLEDGSEPGFARGDGVAEAAP